MTVWLDMIPPKVVEQRHDAIEKRARALI